MKKVLFISSCGGHLSELMQLNELFKKYDYHIITEKTKTTVALKKKYEKKIDYLIYGTKDHIFTYPFKLLLNSIKSIYLYFKIKPSYIITTGAHTAGPMCVIGKCFGAKIIYIETFANRYSKTMTGSLIYKLKLADLFIVQHKEMLDLYPKAVYGGWIF